MQYGGQLGQVEGLCDHIGDRNVLVVGPTGGTLTPALRTICGVNAVLHTGRMTARELAAAQTAFGSHQLIVVTWDATTVAWASGTTPPAFSSVPITQWPLVLNERPVQPTSARTDVWIGTVGTDGTVTPFSPVVGTGG